MAFFTAFNYSVSKGELPLFVRRSLTRDRSRALGEA
jgi:hypothetical protein